MLTARQTSVDDPERADMYSFEGQSLQEDIEI